MSSVFEWHIPLSDLDYDHEEEAAALRVLRSKWLSMGKEIEAFEREFACHIGSHYAISVTNGTAALHLAFLALGLGPGDEVIQPAINFVAAANVTIATGATPVFADIASIDEPVIEPRLSAILEICKDHRLALIEDACHSVGAQYRDPEGKPPHGKMAGNLGDVGCFSFFSNKNMAVGEGGMITTNDEILARKIRLLRSHGMTTLTWDRYRGHADTYDVLLHGFNCRLDEIRAAFGRVQLQKLPKNNERRKWLVGEYGRRLSPLNGWVFPFADYRGSSSYHLAVLAAPDENKRARVARALREARIQTSLHYPHIPSFKAFEAFQTDGLERSQAYARRAITLPLFPGMTESQIEEICFVIRSNI
jgi:dTDP-4-amino-4,6-dideoxygalactose transaminase